MNDESFGIIIFKDHLWGREGGTGNSIRIEWFSELGKCLKACKFGKVGMTVLN